MTTVEFPSPMSGDVEDVVLALDLGRSLWAKGDVREAVRWLRRAAAAAEAAGDDMRGVRLAGIAADIVTEFSITSMTPPPPHVGPAPTPARRMSGPPPLPPPFPPSAARMSAKPPPLPPSPPAQPTPPPPRVSSKPPPLPVATPQPTPPVKVSVKPPPLPPAPPPPVEHDTERSESSPVPPHASVSSLPPSLDADDSSAEARRARTNVLRSFRVYVEQAPEGGLKVHPLREGEKLPAGAREAILVVADSPGSRHPPKGG